jgi:hypothetical protein
MLTRRKALPALRTVLFWVLNKIQLIKGYGSVLLSLIKMHKLMAGMIIVTISLTLLLVVDKVRHDRAVRVLKLKFSNKLEDNALLNAKLERKMNEHNELRRTLTTYYNSTMSEVQFKSKPTPLAVIMPFIKSQLNRVRASLERWSKKQYSPMDPERPLVRTDLIFFYNLQRDMEIEEEIRAMLLEFNIQSYFTEIYFLYAELTPEQDVYPIGTTHMFYQLIYNANLSRRYHYFFYMEPDTMAIRPGWLQELNELTFNTHRPFFVKGSMNRGMVQLDESMQLHINGNAIYSLSRAYREFLKEVKREMFFVFDIDQYVYLRNHQDRMNLLWHRFVFDDFLINMYKTAHSEETIREKNPYTYFIHGGWNVDSLEESSQYLL